MVWFGFGHSQLEIFIRPVRGEVVGVIIWTLERELR